MRSKIFLLFCANLVVYAQAKFRYENYKLYKVHPRNQTHISLLKILENKQELQFWTNVGSVGHSVDILVSPKYHDRFISILNSENLRYDLSIGNIQKVIDNENVKMVGGNDFGWTNYHNLRTINGWLSKLSKKYPKNVTLLKVGKSYEDRDIMGVYVTFSPNNRKRAVFIEGNIHAREWITSAVVTYILNELLTSTDSKVRKLAENYDWYIVPVFNPDGFVYSHTTDRLWRKTRTPYKECFGADPNRNWDYFWNQGGTDNWVCHDNYLGPKPFSEKCVRSLSEFITSISHNLIGYISFHSYSQALLIPYGYTPHHMDNYDELIKIGHLALKSLRKRYGTEYVIGNAPEVLYVTSGGSTDWVKGKFQTRITYTYELRDKGTYGFLLPPEQIIPTAEEVLDSLITIFEEFDKIL